VFRGGQIKIENLAWPGSLREYDSGSDDGRTQELHGVQRFVEPKPRNEKGKQHL
jgi:hypothetical protein